MFATEDMQKAEEAKQAFHAQMKSIFPTIGVVHGVHEGPNREQRRLLKFKKGRKLLGKPTNTQKPQFG